MVVRARARLALLAVAFVLLPMACVPNAGAQDSEAQGDEAAQVRLWFHALGDVDGDGRDELLQVQERWHDDDGFSAQVRALSGRDPAQALWTFGTERAVGPAADFDGDGVTDLLEGGLVSGSSDFLGAPTPFASAYRYAVDYQGTYSLRDGTDGRALGEFPVAMGFQSANAYLFPPLPVVALWAWHDQDQWPWLHWPETGTVLVEQDLGTSTAAMVFPAAHVALQDRDVAVTAHGLDGSVRFTREFADPGHTVGFGAGVGDLDGDGATDAAVADLLTVSAPASGLQLVRPTYVAFGASGELWSVQRDPVLMADGMLPVGDLDGDGGVDVEVLELGFSGLTALILSGKTGAVLASRSVPDGIEAAFPFGDVDADGKDDVLVVAESEDAAPRLGVAGLSLEPRWTTELGDSDYGLGPEMARDGGSVHLTGGPGPDLALLRGVEGDISWDLGYDGEQWTTGMSVDPYRFTIEVRDGLTGDIAWQAPQDGVYDVWPCADVDGRGGLDLCLTRIEGDAQQLADGDLTGARVSLRVLAGEDGALLLEQELRGPESVPLGDDVGLLELTVDAAGDLSGDGAQELAVSVATLPKTAEGGLPLEDMAWYILSLDPRQARLTASSVGAGDGLVPLVALDDADAEVAIPDPEAVGETARDADVALDDADAPGLGVAAAVVALALLAWRRRR